MHYFKDNLIFFSQLSLFIWLIYYQCYCGLSHIAFDSRVNRGFKVLFLLFQVDPFDAVTIMCIYLPVSLRILANPIPLNCFFNSFFDGM